MESTDDSILPEIVIDVSAELLLQIRFANRPMSDRVFRPTISTEIDP